MTSKHSIRISMSGHLSKEELQAYVNGTLDAKRRHEIELHLLDCGLCSDAVHGWKVAGGEQRIDRITRELRHRSRYRSKAQPFLLSRPLLIAIIATVVVLFLIAVIGLRMFTSIH